MNIHLCFHGIGVCTSEREPGEANYWVSRSVFLSALDEVCLHQNVRISFDDGNTSDVETGLPALQERGLRATFFPLAGRLDDPASLSGADLIDLRAAGMTIGSHGWAHVPWRGLSAASARREWEDARAALAEASGGEISEAAVPLGRYDRTVLAHLKDLRYRHVYTSDRFPARESAWLQARYSIMATDTSDTVREIIAGRTRSSALRNVAASALKRLR